MCTFVNIFITYNSAVPYFYRVNVPLTIHNAHGWQC